MERALPPDFVSCPPLPLSCAIIALEDERYKDHAKLSIRLEQYARVVGNGERRPAPRGLF